MTDAQLGLFLDGLLNELQQSIDAASETFEQSGAQRQEKRIPVDDEGNEIKTGTMESRRWTMAMVGANLRGSYAWVDDPNGRALVLLPLDKLVSEWGMRFAQLQPLDNPQRKA